MFPGAGSTIYRNEAGEPIGWSNEQGYEPDPFDDDELDDIEEEEELDDYDVE